MYCPLRTLVALTVLLPVLSSLGPSAQGGLIRLGEPQLLQIIGDDCQLVLNDPLKQDPSVWEGNDNRPLPEVLLAFGLLRLLGLPEDTGTCSTGEEPTSPSAPAFGLAVAQTPAAPRLGAYLTVGQATLLPSPALSRLFRPPRFEKPCSC